MNLNSCKYKLKKCKNSNECYNTNMNSILIEDLSEEDLKFGI